MITDPLLQEILDEKAIIDTTIAYTWAIDNRDWDILRTRVFLPDATASLVSEHEGVESIIARIEAALRPLDASQHMISNHQIVIDGDTATSRCYLQAQHIRRAAEGSPNYIVAGIYADNFIRTPTGWKIKHRTLTVLWTEGNQKVVRP
jgi:SnoaL-like domain